MKTSVFSFRRIKFFMVIAALAMSLVGGGAALADGSGSGGPDLPCPHC